MSAEDFIRRYRDSKWEHEEHLFPGEPVPGWLIENLIRDAWLAGHKQGVQDMREGWEAHLRAKVGETA